MKILNVDFNDNVIWNSERVLEILQRANPKRTEKELKALIKASKLVKNELPKDTAKSSKRKTDDSSSFGNSDNI